MAEAFFNHLAQGRAVAISAGVTPAAHIGINSAKAMLEVGIDISRQKPKMLTLEMLKGAERVINMGCRIEEACLEISVPTEDWGLDDPKGKPIDTVRQTRDSIKAKVEELIKEIE